MFSPTVKILIVDDMMTMRKIVGKNCKELGFTDITEANDGVQAWEKITTAPSPFGLIISDWNMPNCTGLDLLKRVRGDSRFGKTPFLLVTAEAEKTQIMEALQSGVDGYVVKPFTGEALRDALQKVYTKRSAA